MRCLERYRLSSRIGSGMVVCYWFCRVKNQACYAYWSSIDLLEIMCMYGYSCVCLGYVDNRFFVFIFQVMIMDWACTWSWWWKYALKNNFGALSFIFVQWEIPWCIIREARRTFTYFFSCCYEWDNNLFFYYFFLIQKLLY